MIPVILESPFAGDNERNVEYARRAMLDSLQRHEAPLASHLLYTQCLDDEVPWQRGLGIDAGFVWYRFAHRCVAYVDYGISNGMRQGFALADRYGLKIEQRKIGENA